MNVKGIHHLSAMTGDAPGNFKFYTEVLGMRLIKKPSTRMIHPLIIYSMGTNGAIQEPS